MPSVDIAYFPSIPFGQEYLQLYLWENYKFASCDSSNRMVIVQSAKGLMKHFLSERIDRGLKFAINVNFWI